MSKSDTQVATTGQRIAAHRRALGLSQEALGARLGVSRQAIYKWESDAAMPEIEKLVALSRLFGVSVGALLGVEEAAQPSEAQPEALTEEQLKTVEELMRQYLAQRPLPRRWPRVLAGAAALVLLVSLLRLSGQLKTVRSDYQSLQNTVSNLTYSVSSQIGSISNRVESILKSQNELTADYTTEPAGFDLAAGTVTFALQATPKTYQEGMQAVFTAETGGALLEQEAAPGENQSFSANLTCPLTDEITLSVVFVQGDTRQTQRIGVYTGLYSDSLKPVYVQSMQLLFPLDTLPQDAEGLTQLGPADLCVTPENKSAWASASYAAMPETKIRSLRVGLFADRQLLAWAEPCDAPKNWSHGPDDQFFQMPALQLRLRAGQVLCVAAVVEDSFGRSYVCLDTPYTLRADSGGFALDSADSYNAMEDASGWTLEAAP